jgi:hypothetical protein
LSQRSIRFFVSAILEIYLPPCIRVEACPSRSKVSRIFCNGEHGPMYKGHALSHRCLSPLSPTRAENATNLFVFCSKRKGVDHKEEGTRRRRNNKGRTKLRKLLLLDWTSTLYNFISFQSEKKMASSHSGLKPRFLKRTHIICDNAVVLVNKRNDDDV